MQDTKRNSRNPEDGIPGTDEDKERARNERRAALERTGVKMCEHCESGIAADLEALTFLNWKDDEQRFYEFGSHYSDEIECVPFHNRCALSVMNAQHDADTLTTDEPQGFDAMTPSELLAFGASYGVFFKRMADRGYNRTSLEHLGMCDTDIMGAWLKWNDPNGDYTNARGEFDIPRDEMFKIIARQLKG